MKYLLTALLTAAVAIGGIAQDKKPLSPKETEKATIDGASVEIIYCKPSARGRKIMGGLVPYGEVWRTGANAATTIEFSKDVMIEGKHLAKGKYELFTIPNENSWTIIFQKYGQQWGAFSYKEENDVLRVDVKPEQIASMVETFDIAIDSHDVSMTWEHTKVAFHIKG